MKLKISMDPKQFFLDHMEKLLFGLVVLGFLVFVYRAVGRERLSFTPDALRQQAENAKANVAKTDPAKDVALPKPKQSYPVTAAEIRKPTSPTPYEIATAFDKPIKPTDTIKRPVPELLVLEGLRASPGQGAFAMASEEEAAETGAGMMGMAGRGVRGQRWVVVTGLIPYAKQVDLYKQAFEEAAAYDPMRDFPSYAYYRIERAEVDPVAGDTDPSQLNWVRLNVRNAMSVMDLWASQGSQEVVDQRYWPFNPILMFPLGPLYEREWKEDVAHVPEVKLAQFDEDAMGEEEEGTAEDAKPEGKAKPGAAGKEEPAGDEEKPKAKKPKKRTRRSEIPDEPDDMGEMPGGYAGGGSPGPGMPGGYGGSRMPGMPGRPSGMMPGGSSSMGSGMRMPRGPGMSSGYGSMSSGYMGGRSRMPGMPGMPGSPGMGPGMGGAYGEFEEQPIEAYQLFRFFDFEVEPGKHYRYRVKLVLDNPNSSVPPQYVADVNQAKERRMETGWSKPTPMVTVPLDSQVLAVTAERRRQETVASISAKVMLLNFDMQTGSQVAEEREAPRGQWLNFRDVKVERTEGPQTYGMMPTARTEVTEETINYLTDCLLLDATGGTDLPGHEKKRLAEPASILVLDKDGNLVVRSELDDLAEVARHKEPEEGPGSFAGGPGMGSPGPGPGMMNPYGRSGAKGGKMSGSMGPGYEGMMGARSGRGKGSRGGMPGSSGSPSMSPGGMMPGYDGGMDGLHDKKKRGRSGS